MAEDWERLRRTFDAAANVYQQARPEYPEPLYDTLVDLTGIGAGDRVVEVGCATGKATLPLARRGLRITCVEIGPELASAARRNLAAWHWIDPVMRYRRAWELLRPGGHLAFWSATHVFPEDGDPFFAEIQDVYDEIGEALPSGASRPRPGMLPDDCAEIEHSGLCQDVIVRHFDWEVSYTAGEYLRLLGTFSGHIAMQRRQRDRLYAEIRRRLAQRPDGRVHRGWGAVLHVARRADPSAT